MTTFQSYLLVTAQLLLSQPAPANPLLDDFDPAGFLAFLTLGAVFLIFIGIGVALGIGILLLALLGLSLSVLTASVLMGYLNRSLAAGFKTFVLIVSSLLGVPTGIFLVIVVQSLQKQPISFQEIAMPGGMVGGIGGFVVGVLLLKMIRHLKTTLELRYRLH